MKKMTALLLAALMVLSMAACASKPAETAESDLAYIQDKGTLVVGITDFAPMDYQNESGEWVGFDADLAKAFAESLGVKVEFVEIVWDNKVLELDSKTIAPQRLPPPGKPFKICPHLSIFHNSADPGRNFFLQYCFFTLANQYGKLLAR